MGTRNWMQSVALLSLALLMALGPYAVPAAAQPPQPPEWPSEWGGCPPGVPCPPEARKPGEGQPREPYGLPESAQTAGAAMGVSPQATGGPDGFGYTWNDGEPFLWLDAGIGGTDSGLTGDDSCTQAIEIGFDFRFYANVYSQLYISTNGLVSFGQGSAHWSNQAIPNSAVPNSLVAVFWDDLAVGDPYNSGKVYYRQGGTAPDRYFVVEWRNVTYLYSADTLTFEVILHENGDIVVQYQSLSGYLESATVGIEDDEGVDGLLYLYNAPGLSDGKAVRFVRPAPMAQVGLRPRYQDSFVRPGEEVAFGISVRNTGELGADTYDLTVDSDWAVALYAADGVTPLTDNDGSGYPDTGGVLQGDTVDVIVKVQVPGAAGVGTHDVVAITARSGLDATRTRTVYLQAAVPAPFAQVYQDSASGAMSVYLASPAGQGAWKATDNGYYGYGMAVAATPEGLAYVWGKSRWNGATWVGEIEHTLLDGFGQVVRPVSRLSDLSDAASHADDESPAVAVAPNGRIGVLWARWRYDAEERANVNLFFAILDAQGNRVYGPVNLTNNTAYGEWGAPGVPQFYRPRIAATGDNRFALAWERDHASTAGWVSDVYYAVRDSSGASRMAPARLTDDTGNNEDFGTPSLAPLTGNRVLLVYSRWTYSEGYAIRYGVRDSSGGVVKTDASLFAPEWGWKTSPDAAQLSDGKIVVAWHEDWSQEVSVHFAVLNTAYDLISGPTSLAHPMAASGNAYVSVAADSEGRAILTWMGYNSDSMHHLYYALVDGSGAILTPPHSFGRGQGSTPYIVTSYEGYGNTSLSTSPTTAEVDAWVQAPATVLAPDGGVASIPVRYGNKGTTPAGSVTLAAELGGGLVYDGDTAGLETTISGNTVIWYPSDLGFLQGGQFTLYVSVPSGLMGARYPVTLTVTSAGPEGIPANNTHSLNVVIPYRNFLPLVLKGG